MNDLERHRNLKPNIRAGREATQFPLKNLKRLKLAATYTSEGEVENRKIS